MLARPENGLDVRTGGRNPNAEFGSGSYYTPFGGTNRQLNISNPTYVHSLLHHLVGRRAIHHHCPHRIARSVGNGDNVSAVAVHRA